MIAVAVACAILFLFRNYLASDGLLFGDSNLQWDESLLNAAIAQLGHSWAPAFGGGRPSIIINSTTSIVTLLQAAVSPFGIPLSTVLVYPLLLCVAYAGSWGAARKLTGGASAAHIVAIFFVGNPWLWDHLLLGHIAMLAAVAITPWILATLLYREALKSAFVPLIFAECGLMLLCDPRVSYMMFVGLVLAGVYWLARAIQHRSLDYAMQGAALVASPLAALVLNAWWVLPFLQLKDISPVRRAFPPIDEVLSYGQYNDFAHSIVLSGSFLHFFWDRAAAFGPVTFVCWYVAVLFVIAVALLARVPARAPIVLFRLGLLASLFVSMAVSLLPPPLTIWMYAHIPLSALFRDPNKLAFIAVLCIVPLLSVRLRTATFGWRLAILAAVVIVALPTLSGDLHTKDGTGLQPFSERADFVRVLHFLKSRPSFPEFRVGLLPPWTAEVSLRRDEHPVANPFVFQYEVPTMDAKLISVASDMNMRAWRIFEDMYGGHDAHIDRSLAELGIKYLVWNESATLSRGAAETPFYDVPNSVVQHAMRVGGLKEVFRSGLVHVYENPGFTPLVRTIAGPTTAGPLAERFRAALPAEAVGDSVEAVDTTHAAWPFSTIGVGSSARDACFSALPRRSVVMAYDRAPARADSSAYWVDSDYLQRGTADAALGRMLENIPLPYAFTASQATISFNLDVPQHGQIAIQGALLSPYGAAFYSIDDLGWRPLRLPPFTLGWVALERVPPGPHTVVVRGSPVGTVLRAVTAESPRSCPSTYLAVRTLPATPIAGTNWLVPSPFSRITVNETDGKFSFDAANIDVSATTATRAFRTHGTIEGPGADAIMVDAQGTPMGIPFNILLGHHRVQFFAKGMPLEVSSWIRLLLGDEIKESDSSQFSFNPGYTEEGAEATLSDIPRGSTVVLRIRFKGSADRAEVRIIQGGEIVNRYPLASGTNYFALSAFDSLIRVVVHRENSRGGPLVLQPLDAFEGVLLDERVFDLPDRAVEVGAGGGTMSYRRHLSGMTRLRLLEDSRRLAPLETWDPFLVVRGGLATLEYRGLRSTVPSNCALNVAYETNKGLRKRTIADLSLDDTPVLGRITIPILPRTTALRLRFDCGDFGGVLSVTSATLTFTENPEMATLVSTPLAPRATKPTGISHQRISPEELVIQGQPLNVVSVTSFDPAWRFGDNEHFVVNGAANGWIDKGGNRINYTVQAVYKNYIIISLILWSLLAVALVATLLSARIQPARAIAVTLHGGRVTEKEPDTVPSD